jgi:polygalacturonase
VGTRGYSEPAATGGRRSFLRASAAVAGAALLDGCAARGSAPTIQTTGALLADLKAWPLADQIVRRVKAPTFPDRSFPITRFGAVGDGTALCTTSIAAAIDRCSAGGGGRVVVPAGKFLTGAITLRNNVDLHLDDDAVLVFSTDPADYPLVFTRWGGIECYNYSPFIYAFGQKNIALTGSGTIDGQASNAYWWPWSGEFQFGWKPGQPSETNDSAALEQMAATGVPVHKRIFGPGHYLPPSFVQPYRSKNVLIEGIRVINSPFWELHPVLCTNVTVRDVHVDSLGANNDGCDPESCDDVVIENSSFNTGDDCISPKAGTDADGRRVNVPCQNVVIQNCQFENGHGAIALGSSTTGGIRNIFARDLTMKNRNLLYCMRAKTNSARGGYVRDIYMRDVTVKGVATSGLNIDFYYFGGEGDGFNPTVTDIYMRNVHFTEAYRPWNLYGFPDDKIGRVTMVDCTFDKVVSHHSPTQDVAHLTLVDVVVEGKKLRSPR